MPRPVVEPASALLPVLLERAKMLFPGELQARCEAEGTTKAEYIASVIRGIGERR